MTTVLPPRSDQAHDLDLPRELSKFDRDDISELIGSAVAGASVAWLGFARLVPLQGAFGTVLMWFVSFLAIYAFVAAQHHGRLAAKDRVATVLMASTGVLVVVLLVLIIGYVVVRGAPNLRLSFFTDTLETTGADAPSTSGGGLHSIVGTLQQVGIGLIIALPLAFVTAIYLNEVGGRLANPVRFVIDAMSGIPSIVAGLFIYAIYVRGLGGGFSGIASALALALLMLPTITRTAVEVLRLVPDGLREAALAMGAPRWKVTTKVVLPTARSGLVTAIILGVARAVGETAPAILTAFGASALNLNPFEGAQDNLPLFVFRQVTSFKDNLVERAWTGAFVLIVMVLLAFVSARLIGNRQGAHR